MFYCVCVQTAVRASTQSEYRTCSSACICVQYTGSKVDFFPGLHMFAMYVLGKGHVHRPFHICKEGLTCNDRTHPSCETSVEVNYKAGSHTLFLFHCRRLPVLVWWQRSRFPIRKITLCSWIMYFAGKWSYTIKYFRIKLLCNYHSLLKERPWAKQLTSWSKREVGTLLSVSAFNHKGAPTSCLQRLEAPEANNWTQNNVLRNHQLLRSGVMMLWTALNGTMWRWA